MDHPEVGKNPGGDGAANLQHIQIVPTYCQLVCLDRGGLAGMNHDLGFRPAIVFD